jgi:hypothetical protein
MMTKLLGKKQSGQQAIARNTPAPPPQPSRVERSTSDDRTFMAKLLGKKVSGGTDSIEQNPAALARNKGRATPRTTPPGAVAAAATTKAPQSLAKNPASSPHNPTLVGDPEIEDSLVLLPPDDDRETTGSVNLAAIESGPDLGDPTAMRMNVASSDVATADAAEAGAVADSPSEADEPTLIMVEASGSESPFEDHAVVQAALHKLENQSGDHAIRAMKPGSEPLAAQDSPAPASEPSPIESIAGSPRAGDVQLAPHTQSEPARAAPAGAPELNSMPASIAMLGRWTDFVPKDFIQFTLMGIVVLLLLVVVRGVQNRPTILTVTSEPSINPTRRQEDAPGAASGMAGAMITAVGLAIVAVGVLAVVRGHWGGHPVLYRPGIVVAAIGQVLLLSGIVMMAAQASRTAPARTNWEIDLIQSQLDRLRGVMPATAGATPSSSALAWQPQVGASSQPNVPGQIAQIKAQLACLSQQLDHLSPSERRDDRRVEQ